MTQEKSYKEKLWYKALMNFWKFLVHLLMVAILLMGGTAVLIQLEEKETAEPVAVNITNFFMRMEKTHRLNISDSSDVQKAILDEFRQFLLKISDTRLRYEAWVEKQDYYVLFRKWFYFFSIASTTIGYGDVAPSTQEGRVFFIAYSLLTLPAMMTLIARCGKILTSINCHFFRFVHKLCTRKKEFLSEGILSAVLFVAILIGYMQVGPILNSIDNMTWSYIDSIYYWFVTFTTIGFGDINYVINDTQYFLLLYRLFGLALLAGIIDSLLVWFKKRKKYFKKLNALKLRNAAEKMTNGVLKGLEGLPSKFTESRLNPKTVFELPEEDSDEPSIINCQQNAPTDVVEISTPDDSTETLKPSSHVASRHVASRLVTLETPRSWGETNTLSNRIESNRALTLSLNNGRAATGWFVIVDKKS